jgi:hypothetical protein
MCLELKCNGEYFEVELTPITSKANDGFIYTGAYCTHGKGGFHGLPDYEYLEGVEWDADLYTPQQNQVIVKHINGLTHSQLINLMS